MGSTENETVLPLQERKFIEKHFKSCTQRHDYKPSGCIHKGKGQSCKECFVTTKAFGRMKFDASLRGTRHELAPVPYVRLSLSTDPVKVLELLVEHWMPKKKKTPHLVISVTGGTECAYFDISPHVRDAVITSLHKMTTMSNAWVLTAGLHGGVNQLVAEALVDSYDEDMRRVPCIGFCTWGSVENREVLENNGTRTPVEYSVAATFDDTAKCRPLNSNHTHFFLVDDGTEGKQRGHIELVSELKKVLGTDVEGDRNITIPVVTLVIGGGQGTLKNIQETLKKNLPLVIIKDSGRLADVLVFAYDELMKRRNVFDGGLRKPIRRRVVAVFGDHYGRTSIENVVNGVVECMTTLRREKKEYLLQVFDASDTQKGAPGLDFLVLKLIIESRISAHRKYRFDECTNQTEICSPVSKHRKEPEDSPPCNASSSEQSEGTNKPSLDQTGPEESATSAPKPDGLETSKTITPASKKCEETYKSLVQSVQLALDWDRADVLGEQVLSQVIDLKDLKEKQVADFTSRALLEDKHEFVTTFLDHAVVNIKKCMKELKEKRSSANKQNLMEILITKMKITQTDANTLTKTHYTNLTGFFLKRCGDTEGTKLRDTESTELRGAEGFKILFIWALLSERWKVAEVLWSYVPQPLSAALIAGVLLRKMTDVLDGDSVYEDKLNEFQSQEEKWGERACRLLEAFCDKDQLEGLRHKGCDLAETLVMCVSDEWADKSPLELAVLHKNEAFVGSVVVQRLLSKAWMGSLATHVTAWEIIGATFLPLLILSLDQQRKPLRRAAVVPLQRRTQPPGRFSAFYCSPVGRFSLNFVSYLAFLFIFCYSLLVRWDSLTPTVPEVLTAFWMASFLVENCHQLIAAGRPSFKRLRRGMFNVILMVKLLGFLLYVVGATLRFYPHNSNDYYPTTFRWARLLLSLDVCLLFLRGLEFFFINKELGPKLTIIYNMMVDAIVFLSILLVWVVSYGVAVQALLFPFQEASWNILINIFEVPYWQIHGYVFLEYYTGETIEDCVPHTLVNQINSTSDYTICPQKEWLVVVLLAGYLIITVIILLNLLVAIFSDTYRNIRAQSTLIWKFQRYQVINDYMTKFVFPHPLYLLSFFVRPCKEKRLSDLRVERRDVKDEDLARLDFLEKQSRKKVLQFNKEQKVHPN